MSMSVMTETSSVFDRIQTAFYIVPAIPAVIGVALIITGIVVIIKFRHKDK